MGLFNFEDNLVFYGAYHNNRWNRIVHLITVPLIVWSLMVLLAEIPVLVLFGKLPINISFAATFIYIFYYLLLEPAIFAPFALTLAYSANVFNLLFEGAWKYAVSVQVVSWILQFIGHGVFEERAPALFQSFLQAITTAPLFIFMEGLFTVGYRPALQDRIRKRVDIELRLWRLEKLKTKTN